MTKYLNELYADVFGRCYGLSTIGLRYFNVFGPRQDPNGAYAAVVPRWTADMLNGRQCVINGDGETSRDFCFVANVVQANLLAGLTDHQDASGQVYNVAVGGRTTLNQLHEAIAESLKHECRDLRIEPARHADFRPGDVRHSLADVSKAKRLLGYEPTHDVRAGLREAMPWYVKQATRGD